MRDGAKSASTYPYVILLLVVLAVVAYVRIRLLPVPLERDEGEYAYMGQLLLKGIPPYASVYTMKLPGAGLMYALFMTIFGQTASGIHAGLLLVNVLNIFLVYLLTRRLLDNNAALIACASYALLSLSQSVLGAFAHATHLVVFFSLAGLVLLLRSLECPRSPILFVSGLCFGLAFATKQHAAFLAIFGLVLLIRHGRLNPSVSPTALTRSCLLFLAGLVLPFVLIVFWLSQVGALEKFWFWTVTYASTYAAGVPLDTAIYNLMTALVKFMVQLPLWLMAIAGFVFLVSKRGNRNLRPFVIGLVISSILAVCPGLHFREHYFVMTLPAVSILIGYALTSVPHVMPPDLQGRLVPYGPAILFSWQSPMGFSANVRIFSFSPLKR